jgi:hypothetical protein
MKKETECPAINICEHIGTNNIHCNNIDHITPNTAGISQERNSLSAIHSRLRDMQDCLRSIVFLLGNEKTSDQDKV